MHGKYTVYLYFNVGFSLKFLYRIFLIMVLYLYYNIYKFVILKVLIYNGFFS